MGALGLLPLAMVESEARALSLERALIISLQPNCNGADMSVSCKPKGYLLAPSKAGRCRPPAPLRAPKVSSDSVWLQLHFEVQVKKTSKAGIVASSTEAPIWQPVSKAPESHTPNHRLLWTSCTVWYGCNPTVHCLRCNQEPAYCVASFLACVADHSPDL